MMFAPLLMLAAATQLPTTETSPLATPDTVHDWVFVGEDDDVAGWYDRTFEDTILFEGQPYPVVLIRFVLIDEGIENVGDMVLAVDCTEKQMAVAAAWLKDEEEIRALYDGPEGMTFDFVEPPFDSEDIILFRQACGQGWKP